MNFTHNRRNFLALLAALIAFGTSAAPSLRAGEMKLEAQLVWGTNDEKSPDPKHKPVTGDVERKLKRMPFKWKNYFEVSRQNFSVAKGESKKISMSKDCMIEVRNLDDAKVEVTLFGKGAPVGKMTQPLPKGELLVAGGNAENSTAWFVALRQKE